MKTYILPFLIILITVFFITSRKNTELTSSFYHWENTYKQKETKEKLYIKILEITYSTQLEPIRTVFKTKADDYSIPTIYITNKTMKNVDYSKILKLIENELAKLNFKYNEIQIDCDWSLSSKSNYFNLLKNLKEKSKKTISATIRLHQIKYYSKTGIPPVDYGVLMYYNMSDIRNPKTKNSILDNTVAKKYHYNFDTYGLKLKLALPLYSQAIQFRKEDALSIFEGVEKTDFDNNFNEISLNTFEVLKSTYFKGRYVYKGDIFRFEESKIEDIQIALNDFVKLSNNSFNEIIFYRLKYKNKYKLDVLLKGQR